MIDYRGYEVKDFLDDPSFRKWVLGLSAADKLFWDEWVANNADRAEVVEASRSLLLSISNSYNNISDEEIKDETHKILNSVQLKEGAKNEGRFMRPLLAKWWVAASVVMVAVTSIYFLGNHTAYNLEFV